MSNYTKCLVMLGIGVYILWLIAGIAPIPASINGHEAFRNVILICLTLTLTGLAGFGMILARRGYPVFDFSFCLAMVLPCHLTAFGADEYIKWLPAMLVFSSLLLTGWLTWQHS